MSKIEKLQRDASRAFWRALIAVWLLGAFVLWIAQA